MHGLTSVGFQGRADHGHHGGFAVATYAVLQNPGQLAIPALLIAIVSAQVNQPVISTAVMSPLKNCGWPQPAEILVGNKVARFGKAP